MVVLAEVSAPASEYGALVPVYKSLLKRKLGIEVEVELVAEGQLTPLTQVDVRQKPIRLIDERFK